MLCSSGRFTGAPTVPVHTFVPVFSLRAYNFPLVEPMYTMPFTTIGAELRVPSPVNDHFSVPELMSLASNVETLRKKPVEP